MGRKLPPLSAVRAFEAAARTGSTVAAAEDLRVTHGAVSRQIKALEEWLAVPLFERRGARLVLTDAGRRYAAATGRAFGTLEEATRDLALGAERPLVHVSTTASFAAKWLIGRLPRFRKLYPGIEVWISESQALVEPWIGGPCDVAVRMGAGPNWPGVKAEPLMSDQLFPVCSPTLASRLARPADLEAAPLLHDQDPQAVWLRWLTPLGLGGPAFERGPRFASSALLLQASIDSQGVALARARLAAGDLGAGRLVRPFPEVVDVGTAYWLISHERGDLGRSARIFCRWLRSETGSDGVAARAGGSTG